MSEPLWRPDPSRARASAMSIFFAFLSARVKGAPRANAGYEAWHAWSVREPANFWSAVWRTGYVIADTRDDGEPWDAVLVNADRMEPPTPTGGPRWFTGARLNFAENVLRRRDPGVAIIARDESGGRREISYKELADQVRRASNALRAMGVKPGDRVAGFLPNIPEAVVSALAASAIGAVWSSCSPDFGVRAVLDRFGQIEPTVLIVADGYQYAGKRLDCLERVDEIVASLPSVRATIVVPFNYNGAHHRGHRGHREEHDGGGYVSWGSFLESGDAGQLTFTRRPFDHPLYVMYSSGTTGLPKCMVHGAGGTLLQHIKEHRLHTDLKPNERIFYFTTCGWMMWNWLVSALASEATIVLYDGAPLPEHRPAILWDLAAEEKVAVFGTSAKFLAMSEKLDLAPARTHELSNLRAILSTGSPLAEHSYDYVYRDIKEDVHLASISGGTDLISCFALGNPMLPVYRGELQCRGLGMAVEVWDPDGRMLIGKPGELVCTRPFPSMPIGFWNDPDSTKYNAAYFDYYDGAWRHGDWAEITPHNGLIIHGRSDATLNPGGVRIGTAEIYRVVEQMPEILESIVIGQEVVNGPAKDVRIVLFVRLRADHELDDALRDRIRKAIRASASPHHVPKVIEAVSDIPRTISGKISEIAVRDVVHGRAVKNTDALANPEALRLYQDLPALRT